MKFYSFFYYSFFIIIYFNREKSIEKALNVLNSFKLSRQEWKNYCPQIEINTVGDRLKKSAANILVHSNVTLNEIVNIINTENEKKLKLKTIEENNDVKKNNENNENNITNDNDKDDNIFSVPLMIYDTVDAHCKYNLYLNRQENEINRFKSEGGRIIPSNIEYTQANFPTLSSEELEKLQKYRPETLHQASLIEGMTQAGLMYLLHFVKRKQKI